MKPLGNTGLGVQFIGTKILKRHKLDYQAKTNLRITNNRDKSSKGSEAGESGSGINSNIGPLRRPPLAMNSEQKAKTSKTMPELVIGQKENRQLLGGQKPNDTDEVP